MRTFAQGEIYARKVKDLPDDLVDFTEKTSRGEWIISHSEQGNHHVIDASGVTVMERERVESKGVRILYAIVDKPSELRQDAGNAHEEHKLDAGSIYELRISRTFNSLTQQARRVTD